MFESNKNVPSVFSDEKGGGLVSDFCHFFCINDVTIATKII